MTLADILRQQAMARQELAALAKLVPECFDKNGKPIVATLTFPPVSRSPRDPQGGQP